MAEKNILLDLTNQLIAVANTITVLADISKSAAEPEYEELPLPDEPEVTVTFEELRAVMADKVHDGKRDEIKVLLRKYKAEKLSDVDPKNYAALKAEAEVL